MDTARFRFIADALRGDGVFRPQVAYDANGKPLSTGRTALVRYQRESDEKFARRNDLAWYRNHLASACKRFVGYLAKKPPMRSISNPLLEDFAKDCDWRGNALDVFWQDFMVNAKARGSMLLLIDMPRFDAQTLADQINQRFFPYLIAIAPEDVISYKLDMRGRLSMIEYAVAWNGKAAVKGWNEREWWVRIGDERVDGDEHGLGLCPVIAFTESGDFPAFGEFAQIADISRRLFNAWSELDEILRAQTFSLLTATYDPNIPGARESLEAGLKSIGTSNALMMPGGTATFIAPPDGPAQTYLDVIDRLEKALREASLDVEQPSDGRQESGIALTIRFQALNSSLTSFARRMEDFERRMWDVVCAWLNLPTDRVTVEWAKDYALADVKTEIETLSAMQLAGFPPAAIRQQQKQIAALLFASADPSTQQEIAAAIDEPAQQR